VGLLQDLEEPKPRQVIIKEYDFSEYEDRYHITTSQTKDYRSITLYLKKVSTHNKCLHDFDEAKVMNKLTCKKCGTSKIRTKHIPPLD
jgi:hypothetical protein